MLAVVTARPPTVELCNDTLLTMLGYARRELEGGLLAVLFHSDCAEEAAAVTTALADGTRVDNSELVLKRKDGTGLRVLLSASSVSSAHLLAFRDASNIERLRSLEAMSAELSREKARLQAVLASLATGVIVADPGGKFTLFNDAGAEILGMGASDVRPSEWSDHYGVFELDGVTKVASKDLPLIMVLTGSESAARDLVIRNPNLPNDRIVAASARPIVSAAGFEGGVVVFNDVTDRREAERAVKQANAELQRSNADLEQFAYVASHDLQEPLRMIASYTELLAKRYEGKLDDKADKYIRYAHDGARRMQLLLNDLLELSRVGRGDHSLSRVALNDVVAEALDNLEGSRGDAEIIVGELPTVSGYRQELVRVFQNIVGNAIKYRSVEPLRVHVDAERDDDSWHVRIGDNGIGFDPEHATRIFQTFQRLHERGQYDGTGIGLAIVSKIVDRHGGRVWAEGRSGHGATFHVTFPLSPASPPRVP